jgi:rhodanese-related sulfurtransferase
MPIAPELLSHLDPVRGLSPQRLAELASLCEVETFPIGTDIVTERGITGQFVYLLSGELKIVLIDGSMRLLVGACEMANWPLGYKTVLPLKSKAITEIRILCIDFDLIDIMMTWDELSAVTPSSPAPSAAQMATGVFNAQALTSGVLAQLPPAHISELLNRLEKIRAKRGEIIIREGSEGDYYYLIESGRCEVTKRVGGAEVHVADLRAGNAFGEEALISGEPRNATVTMKTEGDLLRLAKADFLALLRAPLLHALDRGEAERRVASGKACWLDVRYPAEFTQDGFPGAVNIPLNEIRNAFGLLDKRTEYIVYCQSGRRSSAAAFLLAQQGFSAFWLPGGLAATEHVHEIR